jgi:RND family efflux transporter MFP subunit
MNNPHNNGAGRHTVVAAAMLAVVVAIGAGLLVHHAGAATAPPPKAAQAVAVTAAVATFSDWPAVLEASGAIAPWQEAVVGAQVTGLHLTEVNVNVGDQVKKGQILARFDEGLLRADEAQLKAAWTQADTNRRRAQTLKDSGGISEQDILQYTTQADTARAQLDAKELQLRYAVVVAPDDGIISARSATLGAVAGSGQELFRMIRQNRLEWRGELNAAQLAQIVPGQRISLALPDGGSAGATVRQTAPSLDVQTRLGLVYADLDGVRPKTSARAGMYANGRIVLAQKPALAVPAGAVVIRDGRSYVLKLPAAGATRPGALTVALTAVTTGRRQGTATEIVSGLKAGDNVVVQGAGFLNEGDAVRVAAATGTTAKE